MKPRTFLLSLLLLPYLIWVAATVFSLFLVWILIYTIGIIPGVGNLLLGVYGFSTVYSFGIVFWGVPYTIFALGFFLWSKNKSSKKTYSTLLYSPLLLACIAAAAIMIFGAAFRLASGKFPPLEDWKNLGLIS